MERSTCTAVVHDMQVFGPQTVTRTHCDNRNVFPVKQRYQHVLKKVSNVAARTCSDDCPFIQVSECMLGTINSLINAVAAQLSMGQHRHFSSSIPPLD
jgi:hypothetical protein